jgi:hypothetical protein
MALGSCSHCTNPTPPPRGPIVLAPAVLDRDVLTLDEAGFLQPIAECAQTVRVATGTGVMPFASACSYGAATIGWRSCRRIFEPNPAGTKWPV